jgi:hypothetical protein
VFGELLAVVGVELPDDVDEGNEEEFALGAVMAAEFGALMTPELLTELHGADVLLSAPRPAGIPEVAKLISRGSRRFATKSFRASSESVPIPALLAAKVIVATRSG